MVKKDRNVKSDTNLKTAADVLQKSHCYDPFFAVVLQILAAVENKMENFNVSCNLLSLKRVIIYFPTYNTGEFRFFTL